MYKQKLHEIQSELAIALMMQKEHSADVEAIQKKYDIDQAAAVLREKDLEGKFSLTVKELSEKIILLEKEKKSEEDTHKIEIKEMECKVKQMEQHLEEVLDARNSDELRELQLENEALQEKAVELHIQCQQIKDENIQLTTKIAELTSDLSEANACLAVKQEDLASCKNCLMSAQAELAITKTELEVLKSNPQPKGQKGNSLFAEVEDKRLDMKKRLDAVLHKYRHLKKMYMDKCAEDNRISAEFVFLRRKCDQILLEIQIQEKQLTDSYKTRIKNLEEQVQKLQRQQKPPYIINNTDNATMKFVETYIESTRKECKKVKEELEAQSVCALFSNETLFRTQHELQRKEAELMQAKVQITELQKQIKEKKDKLED
ncbi:protein Spindly isoform X2 [Cryptotermes secundus]|nr:protein Spindly isoform X2 [Cryptotermes secundus]